MANEMNDVVVADDNPLIVSVISEIFKGSGYTVWTAQMGSQHSHRYETEPPMFWYRI